MKLKEIVQRIQSLYSKGRASDDTRLSDRHIVSKINTSRALLLKREADLKRMFSDWNYQTIPCIETIEAPVHECPCVPVEGCLIIRSKEKLPKPLHYQYGDAIQSVTSLDGSIIFSKINWKEAQYKMSNKYTAGTPSYYIRNDYLYLVNVMYTMPVTMTFIADDPLEVLTFPSFCDAIDYEVCTNPLEEDYPVDAHLIEPIIEMASRELVQLFASRPEDNENNAKDTEGGQE